MNKYQYKVQGVDYDVEIEEVEGNVAKVNVGDTVKQGDVVLVLEAMKMQNNIESEYDGKVTSITVKQGETVMEGSVLLTIG